MAVKMSGDRFFVTYLVTGNENEAREKANAICFEQTAELPEEAIQDASMLENVSGRLESFVALGESGYEAKISYAVEIAGLEFTQLLNIVFGNISLRPGIRLTDLELPESVLKVFKGPRFGRAGIRELLKVPKRPILCTTLKPMGLSAQALSELAYKLALGGIDIIKDDHVLANQPFAPFYDRIQLCAEAVNRANVKTGQNSMYVAGVTAPDEEILQRIRTAKDYGARGLMVAPGIIGLDAMRRIADDNSIALPIFAHPSFMGSFVVAPESGIAHGVLFGQIARLAGADASVFPGFGGRFSFTREECKDIVKGASREMLHVRPLALCAGGPVSAERLPEMLSIYGQDVILLIGGELFKRGPDLVENCKYFRSLVDSL